MMTDDNQNTYEAKILETLIKNSEGLAIVETEVKNINSKLNWLNGSSVCCGCEYFSGTICKTNFNSFEQVSVNKIQNPEQVYSGYIYNYFK